MISFIPFIPPNTKGVSDDIWKAALHSWASSLSELLDMEDKAFLEETVSNTSLSQFIERVFNQQMDNSVSLDSTLINSILLVYLRLSTLDKDTSTPHPLLTIDKICSFAVIYGGSNADQVRTIMLELIKQDKRIEEQLKNLIDSLIENVQSMPTLLTAPIPIELLDRAYVLCRVLDALLSATLFADSIYASLDTLDTILVHCYYNLISKLKTTVEKNPDAAPHAYLIKRTLVSCFNSYADIHFFLPLGLITSSANHRQLVRVPGKQVSDVAIDSMSEKILGFIETSGLDSTCSAFVDGPLIMDWEVEYHIMDKLEWINSQLYDNDEDRIEFLKLSMEQVRSSNEGTGTWGEGVSQPERTPVVDSDIEITSKISELHELFPDFGDGFLEACLHANNNDVEQVVMQLLENNLPPSVDGLDRTMERNRVSSAADTQSEQPEYETESRPVEGEGILKTRHNIYDNDEFDIFNRGSVDTSKVYVGKKNKADADTLLDDKTFIQNEKKNVLQLVVDMYEDEYDDTYDDINDAGVPSGVDNEDGDTALDIVKKKQQNANLVEQNDSILVHTFVENPELFGRKADVRRSKKRVELRNRTGMSDEQLEGWAIMFNRNPRKQRILDKYMLFDGKQAEVSKETSESQKQAKSKENKKPPVSEARDRTHKDKRTSRHRNIGRDKKMAKASPLPQN